MREKMYKSKNKLNAEPHLSNSAALQPCNPATLPRFIILLLIFCLLLPTACTATRPVYKIGLIAPFEGLYRRTGYEALLAMRSALSEYPNPQVNGMTVDLLPLAQNDNHLPENARRTAQKMLLDGSVQGVIGPFSPATAQAVGEVFAEVHFTWAVPFVVNPDALSNGEANLFALPFDENAWANELLQAIARQSQALGTQRLLFAGQMAGWPQLSEDEWSDLLEIPVVLFDTDDSLEDVLQDGDAVIWLGEPDAAAAFFAKLRPVGPETPFWMGPQGGDPTFGRPAMSQLPPFHI